MTEPVDPRVCPLCQGTNACGAADGKETCWCFEAELSPAVLERVPSAARGKACICEACARGAERSDAHPATRVQSRRLRTVL